MSELSPAAQAVLDAFWKDLDFREDFTVRNIAAALRAAADQLTPYSVNQMEGAAMARNRLLAMVWELEGHGQA